MVKKFHVTIIFRELNFRFRGHPRKFITVHRENYIPEFLVHGSSWSPQERPEDMSTN